ncbi:hypothetical protein LNP74_15965 [Klebsiella pneumoniae subsp. pneumoniae]|nr:hypothetical protein [Klebsiella pneumoniae subsp. pneumoniae]
MSACTECGRCHRWKSTDGNQPINVASKKDDSPATAADIAAHKVIVSGLQALDPDTPILSGGGPAGVGSAPALAALLAGRPLDGTKEFIARNGEFTVNIALIENGKPDAGRCLCAGDEGDVPARKMAKPGKKSAAYASRSRSAMPVRRWW